MFVSRLASFLSQAGAAVSAILLLCNPSLASADADPVAEAMIARAQAQLGQTPTGEAPRFVTARVTGEAWMLEQSGNLDGGWLRLSQEADISLDLRERRGEVTQSRRLPVMADSAYGGWQIRFGPDGAAGYREAQGWSAARSSLVHEALRYMDLFPASLLSQAALARDLQATDASQLQFTRLINGQSESVTLTFQPASGALVGFALESELSDDMMLTSWGVSTVEGRYGFWWRDESGITQPRQLELTVNGRPWMRYELSTFEWPAALAIDLAMPEAGLGGPAYRSIAEFPFSARHENATELARVYYGAWNAMVVDQGDGLAIIEAPISASYVEALLAQLAIDFPGRPVKAAFTTSNSWPHAAGVAGLAAAGIDIYAHPDNIALVNELIERAGVTGTVIAAPDGMAFGSGEARLVVRHAPGPELNEMMFIVLPGQALVWASDTVQLDRESQAPLGHAREYIAEMLTAVCADIGPDFRIVDMHAELIGAAGLQAAFDGDSHPPCPSP
tara:strand:- start:237 stop:1751 length:1515 start_codon:yes stop_codon:yes gene_type:complete